MKNLISLTLLLGILFTGTGCYRQDIRTVVFNVPQMGSPECIKIIQDGLSAVEGIQSAQPDLTMRTIAVTYNSTKLSIKNIEYVMTGVGFDVNESKARPGTREKLPAACR